MEKLNNDKISKIDIISCLMTKQEVSWAEIKSYDKPSDKDYAYGGWYLIENAKDGKIYVGKSVDYMARLKNHLLPCQVDASEIGRAIHESVDEFNFYLIAPYSFFDVVNCDGNIETYIEQLFINELINQGVELYNIAIVKKPKHKRRLTYCGFEDMDESNAYQVAINRAYINKDRGEQSRLTKWLAEQKRYKMSNLKTRTIEA